MVKGGKGDLGHQRMNYLYQAAHCVLARNPENTHLARFYIETMKSVAAKLVLRLDPSVKRTICKKCSVLLVPGVTATVRVKGRRQKRMVVRCLDCRMVRRFIVDKEEEHVLWADKPEAVVERG